MKIQQEKTYKIKTQDFLDKVSEWLTEETKTAVVIKDWDFEYDEKQKSQIVIFIPTSK